MAVRALGPAALAVTQAVRPWLDHAATVGRPVVVGVSGGADSMALAAGVAAVAGDHSDDRPVALVVDHGLQAGSSEVAAAVVTRVQQLGLDARSVAVKVDTTTGDGLEAAARAARLTAFGAAADHPLVLLGHSLDDQAETVLMALARGSGSRSLAAMAAHSPMPERGLDLVRPLLALRRETLRQACVEWGLETWADPHNSDERFLRVRVRHEVMPVLRDVLGNGVDDALARTAALARDDADLLDDLSSSLMGAVTTDDRLVVADLDPRPALLSRVVRVWLASQGIGSVPLQHTRAVMALVTQWRGQGPVQLPGGVAVRRVDGALVVERVTGSHQPVGDPRAGR